jgi:mannitol/fructose-specific phosphotransferase system IIA component (Ntr-type)
MQRLKRLAHQTGSRLRVFCGDSDGNELAALIRAMQPSIAMEFTVLPDWPAADEPLASLPEFASEDLLVLVSARRETLAWQPSLDRLPALLADRFPDTNFVVVYPLTVPIQIRAATDESAFGGAAETAVPELPAMPAEADAAVPFLPPLRAVVLDAAPSAWEPAVAALLAQAMPADSKQCAAVVAQVATSARTHPIELQPGVVLLHAHCEEVEELQLHLARCRDGLTLPGMTRATNLLLVLLTPREYSTEHYLKALDALARFLHHPKAMAQVQQAATADAVRAIFAAAPPSTTC